MLKNILKLNGVNQLKTEEKKNIKGGTLNISGGGPYPSGPGCEQNGCQDHRDVCCSGVCLRFEHALALPFCDV